MHRLSFTSVIVLAMFMLVVPTQAATDKLRTELEALISSANKKEGGLQKIVDQGRELAAFCANCHGKDGNSTKPDVPNLAAQNPFYLLEQINKFATGDREDYTTVMQQLSKNMSKDEKLALAIYYAYVSLKPNNNVADADTLALGLTIYNAKCAMCHGKDGNGQKNFARIAGQQQSYLKKVLTAFRDGDSGRQSAIMTETVKNYSDEDLDIIASYVSQLKP